MPLDLPWDDYVEVRILLDGSTDITCDVKSLRVGGGRASFQNNFEPASAQLWMENPDGRYSPNGGINSVITHLDRLDIEVRDPAAGPGPWVPLITGTVRDVLEERPLNGHTTTVIDVVATTATIGQQEFTVTEASTNVWMDADTPWVQRENGINSVLELQPGVTLTTDIDATGHTLQAIEPGTYRVGEYYGKAATSAGHVLWIRRDGILRSFDVPDDYTPVPVQTFYAGDRYGPDGDLAVPAGGICGTSLTYRNPMSTIVNAVTASNGESQGAAEDSNSVSQWGRRTYELTNLITHDPPTSSTAGEFLSDLAAKWLHPEPGRNVNAFAFPVFDDPDALAYLLSLEYADPIQIVYADSDGYADTLNTFVIGWSVTATRDSMYVVIETGELLAGESGTQTSGASGGVDESVAAHSHNGVYTRWSGPWNPSQRYFRWQIVTDGAWLMVANTETEDRPAPQEDGPPYWMTGFGDLPPWSELQAQAAQVVAGARVTSPEAFVASGFRVWGEPEHRYTAFVVVDPTGTDPVVDYYPPFVVDADGWVDLPIPSGLIRAGVPYDIGVAIVEETPGTQIVVGNWDYVASNGNPGPGQAFHQNAGGAAEIRFHYTDSDAVDRTTELSNVQPGDEVRTASQIWTVTSATDNGTFLSVVINPQVQDLPGGVKEFTWTKTIPNFVDYVRVDDHWGIGGPVQGFYSTTGYGPNLARGYGVGASAITLDQHAYGIDIEIQPIAVSDDWDFLAYSGGTGGGGSGGARYLDDLLDVDLTGLLDNQILAYDLASGLWLPVNQSAGPGGDFLPLAGGTMTGPDPITFEEATTPTFQTFTDPAGNDIHLLHRTDPEDAGHKLLTYQTDPLSTSSLVGLWVRSDEISPNGVILRPTGLAVVAGTNTAPGLSFIGDPDTGLYADGTDIVAMAAGGNKRMSWEPSQTVFHGWPLRSANSGTAASPVYSWVGDPDSGLYRETENSLAVSVGGLRVIRFANTSGAYVQVGQGTVSRPGLGFDGDSDTGIYRVGPNHLGITVGGARRFDVNGTDNTVFISTTVLPIGKPGTGTAYYLRYDTTPGILYRTSSLEMAASEFGASARTVAETDVGVTAATTDDDANIPVAGIIDALLDRINDLTTRIEALEDAP